MCGLDSDPFTPAGALVWTCPRGCEAINERRYKCLPPQAARHLALWGHAIQVGLCRMEVPALVIVLGVCILGTAVGYHDQQPNLLWKHCVREQ